MESIVVAIITGVVMSNSKSRAITDCEIDALAEKVAKHNQLIKRIYELERLGGDHAERCEVPRGERIATGEFLMGNEWYWRRGRRRPKQLNAASAAVVLAASYSRCKSGRS